METPPGTVSLLGGLVMLLIFTMLVITIMNKTHELIYLLPDRVLAWIGANGMALGEDAVSSRVESGVGQIKAGANTAANTAASAISKSNRKSSETSSANYEPSNTQPGGGGVPEKGLNKG